MLRIVLEMAKRNTLEGTRQNQPEHKVKSDSSYKYFSFACFFFFIIITIHKLIQLEDKRRKHVWDDDIRIRLKNITYFDHLPHFFLFSRSGFCRLVRIFYISFVFIDTAYVPATSAQ